MLNLSKISKGAGSILVATSIVFSPVISSENTVDAKSTQSSKENYEIDQNIANIIYNNIEKITMIN